MDFFAAVLIEQTGTGRTMGQRLDRWQNGGDRRWLALLVDAMEEAARPEVRSVPCEAAVLKALRAQLARPALGYLQVASQARH
jgi:hypothetical protein